MKLTNRIFTSTLTLGLLLGLGTLAQAKASAHAKTIAHAKAPAKPRAKVAAKAQMKKHSPLVSPAVFKKWGKKKQAAYIKKIQQALFAFERSAKGKYEYAGNTGFMQPWMSLFPQAVADGGGGQYCMVGGFHRKLVNGKCPTYGRGCSGEGVTDDGFTCGRIWGSLCVSRKNASGQLDISDRCKQAWDNADPKPSINYAAAKSDFDEVYDFCEEGTRQTVYGASFQGNCVDFRARVEQIRNENGGGAPVADPGTGPASAADPDADVINTDTATTRGLQVVNDDGTMVPIDTPVQSTEAAPLPMPRNDRPAEVVKTDDTDDADTKPAAAPSECMQKYRTLGDLACVACGMEESDVLKADLQGQGKDVFEWLSLLGTMAQSYNPRNEPFNLKDDNARMQYQQTVMTMVASFGYCTDDEFKTTDFGNAAPSIAKWMEADPKPLYGAFDANSPATQLFAKTYGLQDPENPSRPMNFATGLFSGMKTKFNMENVPGNQWHFKQALIKMMKINEVKGNTGGFHTCGKGILRRMNEPKLFQMCGLRGTQLEGPLKLAGSQTVVNNQCTVRWKPETGPKAYTCEEGPPHNYISQVKEGELFKNEKMYNKMASTCGMSGVTYKAMRCPTDCRDIAPWGKNYNYQCIDPKDPDPPGKDPECSQNCSNPENPEIPTPRTPPTENVETVSERPSESPESSNTRP